MLGDTDEISVGVSLLSERGDRGGGGLGVDTGEGSSSSDEKSDGGGHGGKD